MSNFDVIFDVIYSNRHILFITWQSNIDFRNFDRFQLFQQIFVSEESRKGLKILLE